MVRNLTDGLHVRQPSISVEHVVWAVLGRRTHQVEEISRKRDVALDGTLTEHLLEWSANDEAARTVAALFQHFQAEMNDVCGGRLCGAETDEEVAHVKKGEALER